MDLEKMWSLEYGQKKPIPDHIGVRKAWRLFYVIYPGLLLSYNKYEVYVPLEKAVARCRAHRRNHEEVSPQTNCTCGFWGLKTLGRLNEVIKIQATSAEMVLVKVNMWGKIIEHAHGYRSQFMYPETIYTLGVKGMSALNSYNIPIEAGFPFQEQLLKESQTLRIVLEEEQQRNREEEMKKRVKEAKEKQYEKKLVREFIKYTKQGIDPALLSTEDCVTCNDLFIMYNYKEDLIKKCIKCS